MKKFGDMTPSELDKLLVNYVLAGKDSFYSDKELAEMKSVANSLLKEIFPGQDPKEIERSNEEFLGMLNEEVARKKLQADVKARRVIIGGETDPLHLHRDKSVFSSPTVRTPVGGLAIRETVEGFLISNPNKSIELPPVSLKGLREFCKFVLEAT